MIQYTSLGNTVYFHFGVNNTSGTGTDGSGAAAHVRKCGAAAAAAPHQSLTPTLLSHASYPAGCYEVMVEATEANGYENNTAYAVYATITADSQTPTAFIGAFIIGAVPVRVLDAHGNRSGL